jgi:hypothetical protein
MTRVFLAEILKLRRSLVLLVAMTPPIMVFALATMVIATGHAADEWSMHIASSAALWSYFLLPMSVIGLTALQAQIEHGPSTWAHTLALPVPRWQIFSAQAVLSAVLVAIVSAMVAIAAILAAMLAGALAPEHAMIGAIPWDLALRFYTQMFLASGLLMAIQWTLAMQFNSFAVPVSIGIGGTFVAIAATGARSGLYFPWLMPVNVMASDPDRAIFVVLLGALGGILMFAAAIAWFGRRDWT